MATPSPSRVKALAQISSTTITESYFTIAPAICIPQAPLAPAATREDLAAVLEEQHRIREQLGALGDSLSKLHAAITQVTAAPAPGGSVSTTMHSVSGPIPVPNVNVATAVLPAGPTPPDNDHSESASTRSEPAGLATSGCPPEFESRLHTLFAAQLESLTLLQGRATKVQINDTVAALEARLAEISGALETRLAATTGALETRMESRMVAATGALETRVGAVEGLVERAAKGQDDLGAALGARVEALQDHMGTTVGALEDGLRAQMAASISALEDRLLAHTAPASAPPPPPVSGQPTEQAQVPPPGLAALIDERLAPLEEQIVSRLGERLSPMEERLTATLGERLSPLAEQIAARLGARLSPLEEQIVSRLGERLSPLEERIVARVTSAMAERLSPLADQILAGVTCSLDARLQPLADQIARLQPQAAPAAAADQQPPNTSAAAFQQALEATEGRILQALQSAPSVRQAGDQGTSEAVVRALEATEGRILQALRDPAAKPQPPADQTTLTLLVQSIIEQAESRLQQAIRAGQTPPEALVRCLEPAEARVLQAMRDGAPMRHLAADPAAPRVAADGAAAAGGAGGAVVGGGDAAEGQAGAPATGIQQLAGPAAVCEPTMPAVVCGRGFGWLGRGETRQAGDDDWFFRSFCCMSVPKGGQVDRTAALIAAPSGEIDRASAAGPQAPDSPASSIGSPAPVEDLGTPGGSPPVQEVSPLPLTQQPAQLMPPPPGAGRHQVAVPQQSQAAITPPTEQATITDLTPPATQAAIPQVAIPPTDQVAIPSPPAAISPAFTASPPTTTTTTTDPARHKRACSSPFDRVPVSAGMQAELAMGMSPGAPSIRFKAMAAYWEAEALPAPKGPLTIDRRRQLQRHRANVYQELPSNDTNNTQKPIDQAQNPFLIPHCLSPCPTIISLTPNARQLDTEGAYIEKLKSLERLFIGPLERVLSPDEMRSCFPEVSTIRKLNEKLLLLLMTAAGAFQPPPAATAGAGAASPTAGGEAPAESGGDGAGEVVETPMSAQLAQKVKRLTQGLAFLKCYIPYINNYMTAQRTLNALKSSRSAVRDLIKAGEADPSAGGHDLASFLISPVQRIPRYELLFKARAATHPPSEMLKVTPLDHSTRPVIEACFTSVRAVAQVINSRARDSDNVEQFYAVATDLGLINEDFLLPWRRFERQGPVIFHPVPTTPAATATPRRDSKPAEESQELFLFTDCIVTATRKRRHRAPPRFEPIEQISLDYVFAELGRSLGVTLAEGDDAIETEDFVVAITPEPLDAALMARRPQFEQARVLSFTAPSKADARAWVDAINSRATHTINKRLTLLFERGQMPPKKPHLAGKNLVCCWGRCLTGPQPAPSICAYMFIVVFAVFGFVCLWPVIPIWAAILEFLYGVVFLTIIYWSVVCTDPGIVPRWYQLPPDSPLLVPPPTTAEAGHDSDDDELPHLPLDLPLRRSPPQTIVPSPSPDSLPVSTNEGSSPSSVHSTNWLLEEGGTDENHLPAILTRTDDSPAQHKESAAPTPAPSTLSTKPANSRVVGGKWCQVCKIYRPPGCKHCYDCDNCVLGFDHHCGVLNNCIAARNHGLFMWMLISVSTGAIMYGLTALWVIALKISAGESLVNVLADSPLLLMVMVFAAALALPLLGFGCFQIGLVCRGRKTVELIYGASASEHRDPNISCPTRVLRRICARDQSLMAYPFVPSPRFCPQKVHATQPTHPSDVDAALASVPPAGGVVEMSTTQRTAELDRTEAAEQRVD
ncbi:putative membrane-associated DHHC5a zinc finger protein [Paratrimastix pyriformis]|uniref:Membrane-associated DHHC5a zinc finger protein n=1 Tax=Paratrimastix pyriformis TaxID=342808 RepID=A0ABQ8UJ68_9EUKA|nr:putative membrane-associated DHHC5a zinc finger protein [Paratrimastix pyriformis]